MGELHQIDQLCGVGEAALPILARVVEKSGHNYRKKTPAQWLLFLG